MRDARITCTPTQAKRRPTQRNRISTVGHNVDPDGTPRKFFRMAGCGPSGTMCRSRGVPMKERADVLATLDGPKAERLAAQIAFLERRSEIWEDIQAGKFPATYRSASGKKYVGAPRRTAIRCDFLLASKAALG